MAVNNISTFLSDIFVNVYRSIVCSSKKKDEIEDHDEDNGLKFERENTAGAIGSNSSKSNLIINEDDENDDKDEEEEDKKNVPLVIILLIMIGYLLLGGYGFTFIEKWSYLQAIYYALISVSTIGDYKNSIKNVMNK
jgi:hypothetical protein